MALSGGTVSLQPTLRLTGVEQKLRSLLLDVAQYINPRNPSELRFTGGWVRDKLLGVDSHDIDVAINDMTGYQFGLKMKIYLDLPGNRSKYGLLDVTSDSKNGLLVDPTKTVHDLHKIEANPEKSKHLETVTTQIFGLDIDLVNLRKETYSDDSRNPQMEFGTPEEDALRRDATVNSLFYNLQTELVEDFTARGLEDMNAEIIRTPLDSYQTFKDDPLRVLRLIRFSSRLNYSIDPQAKASMKDERIKDSLKLKISRERIGVELRKMLKGPDPRMSLSLIDEMELYATIFSDPTTDMSFEPDTTEWKASYDNAQDFLQAENSPSKNILILDENDVFLTWLLAALTPFADAPRTKLPSAKVDYPLAAVVAREGIKATNKEFDVIVASVENFEDIISTKDAFIRRNSNTPKDAADPAGRERLGMAIRRWGATWKTQAIFAILIDRSRSSRDVLTEWDAFVKHLQSLDILDAYDFKPVIDGKQLSQAIGARPGPWMKAALEVVMAWQLRNPDAASADGAIEAVKASRQEGSESKAHGELAADLISYFLTLTIRPLFAKTAQEYADTVTAQGRKVERSEKTGPLPRKYDTNEEESIVRPWKDSKNSHALVLLRWIVNCLTPTLAEKNWPSLIPPILTLLDDIDTNYKVEGCDLLSGLLEATSPSLLKRTGLSAVFSEALKPSLSYLPTLTPEAESTHILNAAYPAMFKLTFVTHDPSIAIHASERAKTKHAPPAPEERTFLSPKSFAIISLLHSHIFPSLTHISPPTTYPRLAATLLVHCRTAIDALGIDTVAEMIHIIPVLKDMLTAPFITTTVECLRMMHEAVATLQLVVANTWPRMLRWRGEVLDAAVRAWLALEEEDFSRRDKTDRKVVVEIRAALGVLTEMLLRAVNAVAVALAEGVENLVEEGDDVGDGTVDFTSELNAVMEADARLRDLISPVLKRNAQ